MPAETQARLTLNQEQNSYLCYGDWSALTLNCPWETLTEVPLPRSLTISLDGTHIDRMDCAGALALLKCQDLLTQQGKQVQLIAFSDKHLKLLQLIESKRITPPSTASAQHPNPGVLFLVGQETLYKLDQFKGALALIGDFSHKLALVAAHWRHLPWPSITTNVYTTGVTALPILALLSFLIGVVLAYQMGVQLETYGASTFIAFLSGMAIFREFAPLITAIIVAGRTSSAFTAQIGSMKINEEIDALRTMGLSPTILLVLPKVLGLLLIFPLLIFWSSVFGVLGAMFMSRLMLHISFPEFLNQLQTSVGLDQLLLGLYKAPVFAILIALVGCFQGFRVQFNADSLGAQTTKSVVQALFLIIIADAVYSVIYSWMDL